MQFKRAVQLPAMKFGRGKQASFARLANFRKQKLTI
ncbi:hypothetical protein Pan258_04960 [Symmachiella dynata]|nr:hypothetical protein Pan258_04960 [Symmachiella dynata]